MHGRLGLLLTTAALAFPASALAEPAFTATLSGATPTFNWEGTGNGISDPFGEGLVPCGDAHTCQDILFKIEDAGDLTIAVDSDGDTTVAEPTGEFGDIVTFQDIDTYLYASDASGEIKGDSLSEESATTKGDENFTVKALQPGFYVLRQEVFLGLEAAWTGRAELTGVAPKAPAAVAPAAPAPAAAPAKKKASKRASCLKKAKKKKNKRKRAKAVKRCKRMKK